MSPAPPNCPHDAKSVLCSDACPRTCSNLNSLQACPRVCDAGCLCNEGKVLHNDACIDPELCPALSWRVEMLAGSVWTRKTTLEPKFWSSFLCVCVCVCLSVSLWGEVFFLFFFRLPAQPSAGGCVFSALQVLSVPGFFGVWFFFNCRQLLLLFLLFGLKQGCGRHSVLHSRWNVDRCGGVHQCL